MHATASSLLLAVLLCLSAAIPSAAQQQKEWTWKDGHGNVHSRADLDEILEQRKLWLGSDRESGRQADLAGADLRDPDLKGADPDGAQLGRVFEPKNLPPVSR